MLHLTLREQTDASVRSAREESRWPNSSRLSIFSRHKLDFSFFCLVARTLQKSKRDISKRI